MPSKTVILGEGAIKAIERAVKSVFLKAKARILGPWSVSKRIAIGSHVHGEFSLPGMFELASREEGSKPDSKTLAQILNIAGGYLDATEARTATRVVKEVTSFISEAHASGVKTDIQTVLGGKLQEVLGESVVSMRRIIDTECNNVKNVGILDGIVRINAASGVEDPVVCFVSVNDAKRCVICTELHTTDGITPRLWKMSELGHGYFKRGETRPCLGGIHPQCRCTLTSIGLGYGFKDGKIVYVGRGHDELAKQRETEKAEPEALQEHLKKGCDHD